MTKRLPKKLLDLLDTYECEASRGNEYDNRENIEYARTELEEAILAAIERAKAKKP